MTTLNFDQMWEAVKTLTPRQQRRLRKLLDALTSDAGLLAYRELDDDLGLTCTAATGLHGALRDGNTLQQGKPQAPDGPVREVDRPGSPPPYG